MPAFFLLGPTPAPVRYHLHLPAPRPFLLSRWIWFSPAYVDAQTLIRTSHSPRCRLYEPEAHQDQDLCILCAMPKTRPLSAPLIRTQKIVGTPPKRRRAGMPCPIGCITNLMVSSQSRLWRDSRHRRIRQNK